LWMGFQESQARLKIFFEVESLFNNFFLARIFFF
jgi:hypothetical protein